MEFINTTGNNVNISNITAVDESKTSLVPRWCEIILIHFLFITAILAVSGNCIILMVEVKNRYKTSTDWLVSFMAVNDVLFAMYNIPIYITYHLGYWKTIASNTTCKIHYFIEEVTMFSSAILLGTVAIDRYFKTCK